LEYSKYNHTIVKVTFQDKDDKDIEIKKNYLQKYFVSSRGIDIFKPGVFKLYYHKFNFDICVYLKIMNSQSTDQSESILEPKSIKLEMMTLARLIQLYNSFLKQLFYLDFLLHMKMI